VLGLATLATVAARRRYDAPSSSRPVGS
jgi:hypothetical protein